MNDKIKQNEFNDGIQVTDEISSLLGEKLNNELEIYSKAELIRAINSEIAQIKNEIKNPQLEETSLSKYYDHVVSRLKGLGLVIDNLKLDDHKNTKAYMDNAIITLIYDFENFCEENSMEVILDKYSEFRKLEGGMRVVKNSEGHYGAVNLDGEEVVKCEFFELGDFHNGFAYFKKSESDDYGYIDKYGNIIFEDKYTYAEDVKSDGYATVIEKSIFGKFINKEKEEVFLGKIE